jgi:DNA-binding NarL/FixJ family response regulator
LRTAAAKRNGLLESSGSFEYGGFSVHTIARTAELTTRELEVIALLADGRSAREIATQLEISRATARTHVTNIYRKLDINNRVEATRWYLNAYPGAR